MSALVLMPKIIVYIAHFTLQEQDSFLFLLGSKRHCQAEEESLIEEEIDNYSELESAEDTVEHSEMDNQGTVEHSEMDDQGTVEHSEMDDQGTGYEQLEKESPEDPPKVEEEENRNNVDARNARGKNLLKIRCVLSVNVCVYLNTFCDSLS